MSNPSGLSNLSDRSLLESLSRLVGSERARRVEILEYLNEVDRRELYLRLGYSSLFEYCVSKLKYSQSAAGRRISTARAMRRFPNITKLLESGDVNIATVAAIAKLLTPSNSAELLARIQAKSQDEVRAIVAEYRPETERPDRVRPVCVRVPAASELTASDRPSPTALSIGPAADERNHDVAGANRPAPAAATQLATPTGGSGSPSRVTDSDLQARAATTIVRKHELRFLAGEEFMRKLEQVKALMSCRNRNASLEDVFAAAIEAFLDKKCPTRRSRRRAGRSFGARSEPTKGVPAAVRDRVHERDQGRCTWVGPGGRRCSATRHLEVDHIVPIGRGGSNASSNLRLLCRAHNLLAAEQVYGRGFMERFVARE